MDSAALQIVEFGRLTMRDWAQLVEGEHAPFGTACAGFEFRAKERHVGMRDAGGALLAACGWSLVEVEVDGYGRLEAVGMGALIVRRDHRGRGLATPVMARVRELVDRTGVARAMLLCEPELEPLYMRRGYRRIEDPVWVQQPSGPVRWPLRAMWRPIVPSAGWAAGVVRLLGPPF